MATKTPLGTTRRFGDPEENARILLGYLEAEATIENEAWCLIGERRFYEAMHRATDLASVAAGRKQFVQLLLRDGARVGLPLVDLSGGDT